MVGPAGLHPRLDCQRSVQALSSVGGGLRHAACFAFRLSFNVDRRSVVTSPQSLIVLPEPRSAEEVLAEFDLVLEASGLIE